MKKILLPTVAALGVAAVSFLRSRRKRKFYIKWEYKNCPPTPQIKPTPEGVFIAADYDGNPFVFSSQKKASEFCDWFNNRTFGVVGSFSVMLPKESKLLKTKSTPFKI